MEGGEVFDNVMNIVFPSRFHNISHHLPYVWWVIEFGDYMLRIYTFLLA